jgi:hypothetical protein
MTLANSGTMSIGGSTANRSINLELGRAAGATSSMGESALRTLAGVASGAISMSNFYGKSNFTPTTVTYNTGFGTETAPTGWSSCRIRIWGGGGGGGRSNGLSAPGGGGGGGGFSEKTITGSGSSTINYVVGNGGAGRTDSSVGGGTTAGQTRVGDVTATGGFAGTNMSANGGAGGAETSGGSGGTATGGSTNTTGNSGNAVLGDTDGGGDAAGTGGGDGGTNWDGYLDVGTWITSTFPSDGSAPGGGGGGGAWSTAGDFLDIVGMTGGIGRVEFYYT